MCVPASVRVRVCVRVSGSESTLKGRCSSEDERVCVQVEAEVRS